ncbi:hypothetical protein FCV25MIE_15350 [Fagus crenata]
MGGPPSMKKQQTTMAVEPGVTGLTGLKEVNPIMGSTSIKHAWQGGTDTLTFTEQLKEIDRDLGIFLANVQMPAQANFLNSNSNTVPIGQVVSDLNGPSVMGPSMGSN